MSLAHCILYCVKVTRFKPPFQCTSNLRKTHVIANESTKLIQTLRSRSNSTLESTPEKLCASEPALLVSISLISSHFLRLSRLVICRPNTFEVRRRVLLRVSAGPLGADMFHSFQKSAQHVQMLLKYHKDTSQTSDDNSLPPHAQLFMNFVLSYANICLW